jgi:hypothetical protein
LLSKRNLYRYIVAKLEEEVRRKPAGETVDTNRQVKKKEGTVDVNPAAAAAQTIPGPGPGSGEESTSESVLRLAERWRRRLLVAWEGERTDAEGEGKPSSPSASDRLPVVYPVLEGVEGAKKPAGAIASDAAAAAAEHAPSRRRRLAKRVMGWFRRRGGGEGGDGGTGAIAAEV